MDEKNPKIKVPLEDWVEQIVERTITISFEKLLVRHKADCDISKIAVEIWGNGKAGLKADVTKLKNDMQTNKKVREGLHGFLRDLAKPVLAALLVAAIFWMFNTKADCACL